MTRPEELQSLGCTLTPSEVLVEGFWGPSWRLGIVVLDSMSEEEYAEARRRALLAINNNHSQR